MKIFKPLLAVLLAIVSLAGCSDNINDSNLFVSKGKTVTQLLEEDPDFSIYLHLLQQVRLSDKSPSSVAQMLSARGNYTVFAPQNNAMHHYLDSIYATPDFDYTHTDDSVAKILVTSSIIDCGHDEAYKKSMLVEGAIEKTNLADRYLTVSFDTLDGKAVVKINKDATIMSSDNEATNGCIHVVDRSLALSNAYLPQIIGEAGNLRIFSMLLFNTGWDRQLQQYRDEEYEKRTNLEADMPQHRYIGYTAFAETDSVFHNKWGIDMPKISEGKMTNADEIMRQIKEKCRQAYPNAKDEDMKSDGNAVNQFVAYHLLPERIAYNKLVIHYGELGFSYKLPTRLTIDCFEYYETMTKAHRRLLKLTEGRQTDGIRINRHCTYDEDDYSEISVSRPGIKILPDNGAYDFNALNGFYYPIDDILVYDDDVPNIVLNERLRFDFSAILPELITNGLRRLNQNIDVLIPQGYFENMTFTEKSNYRYLPGYGAGWPNFQGDEHNVRGMYDLTVKLPPVPLEGTYELRWAIPIYPTRGMAQFYFGTDKDNLSAIGLPVDLRLFADNPSIGWKEDTDDKTLNREKDRSMRNHGYMMPPKHDGPTTGGVANMSLRAQTQYQRIRKIVYTGNMKPDEIYYVRCKSVLSNTSTQFVMDRLELVPKNVYNGSKPEDIW